MTVSPKYQVITPPNTLKAKLRGKVGFDAASIAKAEEALAALSDDFDAWLDEDVKRLEAAWTEAADKTDADSLEPVYSVAHDVKGLGTTYNYPLVTWIAHSLCGLVETDELRLKAPRPLLAAHVHAIRAAVRDQIKTDQHPVGKMLAEELERQVDELK